MKNERYALFPVRGLWMAPEDVSLQLLDRDWALVNPDASTAIDALIPGGFCGHVEKLRERMKPDALLIVRRYMDLEQLWNDWRKVSEYAERVLSALNLLFLSAPIFDLTSGTSDGSGIRSLPVPVWLTRVPEHPELPLIFGRDRFHASGHSQVLSWPNSMSTTKSLTMNEIDTAIAVASSSVRSIIAGNSSGSFENATRALMLSFNTTSQGQFIAQALSSLDIIFGEDKSTRWATMDGYVETLCGTDASPGLVSEVFNQRHGFIHRHREPADSSAHFVALAVVVSAFIGWAELSVTYGDRTTALNVLEASGRLTRAARGGNQNVVSALGLLQSSVQSRPQWVKDWLAKDARPAA